MQIATTFNMYVEESVVQVNLYQAVHATCYRPLSHNLTLTDGKDNLKEIPFNKECQQHNLSNLEHGFQFKIRLKNWAIHHPFQSKSTGNVVLWLLSLKDLMSCLSHNVWLLHNIHQWEKKTVYTNYGHLQIMYKITNLSSHVHSGYNFWHNYLVNWPYFKQISVVFWISNILAWKSYQSKTSDKWLRTIYFMQKTIWVTKA